ncbi:hypothetical protein [Cumulibacter soli]|uniref:hypothetical protein n=1 Tax=Cumulibacter soli TaxID=2546344 RepID=UPI001067931C|nr:hypothetical protein [Cumulibacter soli]
MNETTDTAEMLAILAQHGLTPPTEDLPLITVAYRQALDMKALIHSVDGARYEEPLLVANAVR